MGFGSRRNSTEQSENIILNGEIIGRLREELAGLFEVDAVTVPRQAQQGVIVFSGQLLWQDADAAYDLLAERWVPLDYTPLLSKQDDKVELTANPGLTKPRPANKRINMLLFAITLFSVILAGALNEGANPLEDPLSILAGLPFALTLLVILGTHEFGHYFAAKYHRVAVTLPYFIPMPLSIVGTFGAFIQLRSPVRNRNHLFDVGIAGPLAGLVVAIPLLFIGLAASTVEPLPAEGGYMLEGNSLLYVGAKYLVHGAILPRGGVDVMLHPIAFAAWFGLLVTAFNLLPVGQLDGGHVVFGLLGKNARIVGIIFLACLLVMGIFFWQGWFLWAVLVFLLGLGHPPPLNDITPLDGKRKMVGLFVILIFILVFVPNPLQIVM